MIRYEGTLYRPPSEAESLILQATIGCSYNRCTFCAMYREKRFRVRKLEELDAEITWAARNVPDVRKVFLADGDALIAKPSYLHAVLERLRAAFPDLARVSCYASPQALQVRTVDEMRALREAGLVLYYLGIESGHDDVLARLEKGVDAAEMIRVARKAGTAAAIKPTRARNAGAAMKIIGSVALVFTSCPDTARLKTTAAPTPTAMPPNTSPMALFSTDASTSPGLAPNAMRMPNSCVRWAIE